MLSYTNKKRDVEIENCSIPLGPFGIDQVQTEEEMKYFNQLFNQQ